MAAEIFNALVEDKGLEAEASSAGVIAQEGNSMDPSAAAAMEEIGIQPDGHRSRRVTREMLEEADVVLAMTPWHVERLRKDFGASLDFHTLPEYAGGSSDGEGIPDPRGGAMLAYRATARQLLDHLDLLANRLAKR